MKTIEIIPTEYQECLWLVEYLDILQAQGKIGLYTHIPNETFTKSWSQKVKNKRMGVVRGFPDYIILTKHKPLFIEMKRTAKSSTSLEQKAWHQALNALGLSVSVCHGFEQAHKVIEEAIA